ncbi:MAG: FAD-binding oxidoreductase [Kaiparowitsia implicata GSE-PSE-MK54-09C]|jgi:glycolate oxidase FAD binding subunit|nr:FAD-binding oxidoreductase [Kaiparowitsia implicata GSE-PSE-MK54-09C]
MSAIATTLQSMLDSTAVHPWADLPSALQASIAQAIMPDASPDCVVYPSTVEHLAEVMTRAHGEGWRVLPCGYGSKLSWGGLAQDVQVVLSTQRLNRVLDHAVGDMTVTAEAGMPLAVLQQTLARQGQWLPLNPFYGDRTSLGGMVATGDAGSLRQRYGTVRDLLIGLSLVRADGQVAKAGGRVVKNVAGYDLMKLLTGSWGTLGLLTQLTFRTYPLPETSRTVVVTGSAEAIALLGQALLASSLTPTDAEWVVAPGLDWSATPAQISLVCRFQSIAVSVETQADQLSQMAAALSLPCQIYRDDAEATLWRAIAQQWDNEAPALTCKFGVLPVRAAQVLDKMQAMVSIDVAAINAGSGVGHLQVPITDDAAQCITHLRQLCNAQGGFLTLLRAPAALKQQVDVWGYTGNAIALMHGIKHQFDPQNLLSPGRFLHGV